MFSRQLASSLTLVFFLMSEYIYFRRGSLVGSCKPLLGVQKSRTLFCLLKVDSGEVRRLSKLNCNDSWSILWNICQSKKARFSRYAATEVKTCTVLQALPSALQAAGR